MSRFGAEIELICTIQAMIPDKPWRSVENASGAVSVKAGLPGGDVDPNPGPVGP